MDKYIFFLLLVFLSCSLSCHKVVRLYQETQLPEDEVAVCSMSCGDFPIFFDNKEPLCVDTVEFQFAPGSHTTSVRGLDPSKRFLKESVNVLKWMLAPNPDKGPITKKTITFDFNAEAGHKYALLDCVAKGGFFRSTHIFALIDITGKKVIDGQLHLLNACREKEYTIVFTGKDKKERYKIKPRSDGYIEILDIQ